MLRNPLFFQPFLAVAVAVARVATSVLDPLHQFVRTWVRFIASAMERLGFWGLNCARRPNAHRVRGTFHYFSQETACAGFFQPSVA